MRSSEARLDACVGSVCGVLGVGLLGWLAWMCQGHLWQSIGLWLVTLVGLTLIGLGVVGLCYWCIDRKEDTCEASSWGSSSFWD